MQTLRASKCGLSTAQLPSYILDVIDALTKAGYEAYIVGGGVRDMMLGLNPKDFDAVTNATPSQVKEVFMVRHGGGDSFSVLALDTFHLGGVFPCTAEERSHLCARHDFA